MHSIFKYSLLLSFLAFLPGCLQQPIRVSQQTIANRTKIPAGFSQNKSFTVIGGEYYIDGTKQKNSLQSLELEKKLEIALSHATFEIVPKEKFESAEYAIIYKYGINSTTKTAYEPQLATASIWSSKDHAHVNSTTYVPVTRTYYTKSLELFVVELPEYIKSGKIPAPIWQSETWIVDESNDLRTNLDLLIVEAVRKFGKDTAGTINSDIYKNNKTVNDLRERYNCFEK